MNTETSPLSSRAVWAGRAASTLVALPLLMDAVMKLAHADVAIKGSVELGYPEQTVSTMGVLLLGSLIVYLVPRTAPLGAVLLTGYLGGAIATHVRVGSPLGTHILSPVYVAIFVWGGLWLRDARVRGLLAKRAPATITANVTSTSGDPHHHQLA